MKPQQARLALTGLALGVLLALVLAPADPVAGASASADRPAPVPPAAERALLLRLVDGRPCPVRGSSRAPPRRLRDSVRCRRQRRQSRPSHSGPARPLAAPLPGPPRALCNLLRYETLGKIHLSRPKEEALLNPGLRLDDSRMHYNAPQTLRRSTPTRRRGSGWTRQRLLPPHARRRTVAGFRDAEGLAAFRRASRKPLLAGV